MNDHDPISRRDMLRSKLGLGLARSLGHALGQAAAVSQHIEQAIREPAPPTPPEPKFQLFLRPPGAIEEIAFTAQCTKCDACIDACPADTLVAITSVFGKAHKTPVIDPTLGGCTMYDDRPCAAACIESGTGVLDPLLPMNMGHALIHRSSCQSRIGEECTQCIEACPITDVLTFDWRKIPVVDQDRCTGCGLCIPCCPADPIAISIIPTRDRPPGTAKSSGP